MAKKKREELKQLQSLASMLTADIESLKVQLNMIKVDIDTKKKSLNTINQKINNLNKKSNELIVSEHAIVRYLERVMGIDTELIINNILPTEIEEVIKFAGNGTYPVNNGEFRIVVKDGVVITLVSSDEKSS